MDLMDYRRKIIANSPHLSSASGSIASFSDGADLPLKSLLVDIEPVQSGSGDPSPDNVRPISGWDSVKVTRAGKNVLDLSEYRTGQSANGITYTVNDDMTISASGTATGTSSFYFIVPITVAKKWAGKILDGAPSVNGCYLRVEKRLTPYTRYAIDGGNGAVISNDIINETGDVLVMCRINTGTMVNGTVFKPMIRDASLADSEFEPYNGTTYDISLSTAGTVYGGTLDVLSGELVVDRALVDLGTLTWTYQSETGLFYSNGFPSCRNNTTKLILSNREWTPKSSQSKVRATDKTICKDSNGRFYVHDSSYSATADFQSAMSGSMMCYELYTPLTYQLDPQTVRSLYGQNNIWADTGNVALEYWAHQ